jgi:hypothetical protein
MHAPMAEQQRWYASILRGHYAYYGLPHNWRALNGFYQKPPAHLVPLPEAAKPEGPTARLGSVQSTARMLPPAITLDHSSLGGIGGMTRVTLGKSRVRESCTPGSVRAKAKWLRYSTVTDHEPPENQARRGKHLQRAYLAGA